MLFFTVALLFFLAVMMLTTDIWEEVNRSLPKFAHSAIIGLILILLVVVASSLATKKVKDKEVDPILYSSASTPVTEKSETTQPEDDFILPTITENPSATLLIHKYATVAVDSMEVRTEPGFDQPVLDELPMGEKLLVIEKRGEWVSLIFRENKQGWAPESLALFSEESVETDSEEPQVSEPHKDRLAKVAVDLLNVRSGPALTEPVLETLSQGESVLVRRKEGDWVGLVFHGAKQGWVLEKYLEFFDGEEDAELAD